MIESDLLVVEDDVLVDIKQKVVEVLEFSLPVVQASETIAKGNDRSHVVCANFLDGNFGPGEYGVHIQICHFGLVDETIDGDDVLIAGLSEEGAELRVYVEGALAVYRAICAVQPVDGALVSTVVPAILTAWSAVKVEVNAYSIFACPLDGAEEIPPGNLRDVGVVVVSRDCPV